MKYIPAVTALLWVTIIVGYIFFRDIFILPSIMFPTVTLLSIVLPVSFWTLQAQEKRVFSLIFIGIFCINNAILTYGFVKNYSALNSLLDYTENRIDPDLAKLLISGNSEKERSAVSRIIFQKHGVALPFMTHDSLFSLHRPSRTDKDIFLDNHEKSYLTVLKKQNLSSQLITTFFLIALQVTIFLVLLTYLILFDRPLQKGQQRKKKLR